MTHPLFYNLKETAERIGKSYDWMCREENREKLFLLGFPKPIATPGRMLFTRRDVDNYINGELDEIPPAAANDAKTGHPTGLDKYLSL